MSYVLCLMSYVLCLMSYELLEEIESLSRDDLLKYIAKRSETIVRKTQGGSWDDPEEIQMDSVELGHAVYRLFRDKLQQDNSGEV